MTAEEVRILASKVNFRLFSEAGSIKPYWVLFNEEGCPVAQGSLETLCEHPSIKALLEKSE